ncbi:methyltransferase domain-containing protein [Tribonema minus]|uniref:Methyltransferase domain-containing protein n=1 Tax=Tribonema minus TaxID=303371 RepID=A0A836CK40_9STRA|nr:methyltransferase domain-containing protein [Tribonema minus]|eukprot:TRINITY_DN6906_c0_g1_i1.p1 TRINITY_DN6906_c0_g1~~TRINITY_DN6906_c0_g1_i1.p1  ORF type:complete len:346 (-),score=55.50 TRINITY_DN6906_c0_g1_i1:478-1515(-)
MRQLTQLLIGSQCGFIILLAVLLFRKAGRQVADDLAPHKAHPVATPYVPSVAKGQCPSHIASCSSLYHQALHRWRTAACARKMRTPELNYHDGRQGDTWDAWEPEYDCGVETRLGEHYWGDGPKFMCGIEFLVDRRDCLVYSIGSHEEDGFEQGILKVAPHCEVHTFDPTSDPKIMAAMSAKGGYHFHLMGLGSQAQSDAGEVLVHGPLKTLQEIMAQLGHTGRTLDVFKIDCEGCEWDTMSAQLFGPMSKGELKVGQLQIELHLSGTPAKPLRTIQHFFEAADTAGLRVFHKERNQWGCLGWKCLEYAFVSAEWARHVFHRTHCPDGVADPAELGTLHANLDCD